MPLPILRVSKLKVRGRSTPGSFMGHCTRARPTPNADPDQSSKNRWLIGSESMDLGATISAFHERFGVTARADSTIANDLVLSISPDFFRDDPNKSGTYREDRVRVFEAEAQALLKKTFGSRVVAATLHLDEATPHIHAVVVPILRHKTKAETFRLSGKDMFNPASLQALQQAWEDRLTPHGVSPRQVGSKARHVTLREYYGQVEDFALSDPRQAIEISDPPTRGRLEASESYDTRLSSWKAAEAKRLRGDLRGLAAEASKGRLWEQERRSRSETVGRLSTTATALTATRGELSAASRQLALSKEQVARLRRTPINAIAARLEYTGSIPKGANAIDLVKEIGGLDFSQATAWLAQNFDPDVAATAVREVAVQSAQRAAAGPLVWTKAETTKRRIMERQLDALAAPAYRITVMRQTADGEQIGQNLGKSKDGAPERHWTRDEVLDKVGELSAANLAGGNVFITPIDPDAYHVLIDDLDGRRLDEMRQEGYQPAAVMESSPGSLQAVLKVDRRYPKAAVNEWFKDMNRARGDQAITGLVHPFRLAGFENRKAKHCGDDGKYPFVGLREAVGAFCERAKQVIHTYTIDALKLTREKEAEAARRDALSRRGAAAPRPAPMSGIRP